VVPADTFVVQPQQVPFLATDGQRRRQITEDAPLIDAFQDLYRYG
jgi:hypothetical protein